MMTNNKEDLSFCLNDYELEFLQDTIRDYEPKTLLAIGIPEQMVSFLNECIWVSKLQCCSYSAAREELSAHLDAIEDEIDFLILDSAQSMPEDFMDFIVALPHLKKDAVVILLDVALQDRQSGRLFGSSILFQNISAKKFSHHQELYMGIEDRIRFCLGGGEPQKFNHICLAARVFSNILVGFQINDDTKRHEKDLFAALCMEWSYLPQESRLQKYMQLIAKQYASDGQAQFEQAVLTAKMSFEPYGKFLNGLNESFFPAFKKVLLYGKGKRGKTFLEAARKLRVRVDGFIVSDEQISESEFFGLPVYAYTQIPYKKEDILIIQTAASKEIEWRLQQSGYCWLKLPDGFWRYYTT